MIRPLKLHRCNGNVNIDVHARQAGSPKDLPGLNRVKLSVICSLINLKWVQESAQGLRQWKVQPNRRGCYGESTWAQLCLPVHGSHRGTNLWSLHKMNTRFVTVYNVYRWHCRREEIEDFTTCTFVNGFYPSLKFNWSISDEQLPFLDLVLIPTTLDRLLYTSIHY